MLRPLKISAEFFQQTAPLLPSPHAERVALATFPSLVPLLYFVVCVLVSLYRPSSCVHRRAPPAQRRLPDRLALVPQNTCSDANSIWYSHAVTHHGTNQTRRGLNAGS